MYIQNEIFYSVNDYWNFCAIVVPFCIMQSYLVIMCISLITMFGYLA